MRQKLSWEHTLTFFNNNLEQVLRLIPSTFKCTLDKDNEIYNDYDGKRYFRCISCGKFPALCSKKINDNGSAPLHESVISAGRTGPVQIVHDHFILPWPNISLLLDVAGIPYNL